MLEKFLKELVNLTVGKSAENIAELLNTKKYVNEFIIAKKLDLTINQTRNILYKLSDYGLVSSIRKKDKKKGWYTYSWRFEILKCLEFLNELLSKRISEIELEINDRKNKMFYSCSSCNLEYNEEEALLRDFTCDECGQIFTVKDDSKNLKELSKNLEKLRLREKQIFEELEKERAIIEVKRQKEFTKERKEKDLRRAEAAAKRKVTRELNKTPLLKKKVVEKKPSIKKISSKKPSIKKISSKKPSIKKISSKKPSIKKISSKNLVKKKK